MKKSELKLLERVFNAEVGAAIHDLPSHLFPTKSKLAKKLADEGYLREREAVLGGRFPVTISGYELTELGRITYCTSCP